MQEPQPVLPSLVALGGLKGSGKSTAAQALLDRGYIRVKMAGALKAMLTTLLEYQGMAGADIDRCIEGDLKEEPVNELHGRTPRYAMQTIGAEWGRDLMSPGFWVGVTAERISNLMADGHRVLVDDVRYPNELEMLEVLGATSVFITRPGIEPASDHSSEVSLGSADFHSVLDNVSTIEELHAELLATLRGMEGFRNE
ncbi:MAG: deoxynucleotide monophosphate kinase [Pseudomonadota bacterium]